MLIKHSFFFLLILRFWLLEYASLLSLRVFDLVHDLCDLLLILLELHVKVEYGIASFRNCTLCIDHFVILVTLLILVGDVGL